MRLGPSPVLRLWKKHQHIYLGGKDISKVWNNEAQCSKALHPSIQQCSDMEKNPSKAQGNPVLYYLFHAFLSWLFFPQIVAILGGKSSH